MKFLSLLLFSCFFFHTFAQDNKTALAQDPEAVPYMENVASLLSDKSPFQVEFKYEIVSSVNDSKVSDYGSVIVKGNKYKLKTDDSEVYYNGVKLWSYNVQAGEVYVSEPDSSNTDESLTDPFRLIGNYKTYYKYRYKGEQTIKGKTYQEIDLYPVNLNNSYSILRLLVYNGGKSIYSFTIQQKNGIDISIYVTDVIRNISIDDKTFEWDEAAHPDVLVVEM